MVDCEPRKNKNLNKVELKVVLINLTLVGDCRSWWWGRGVGEGGVTVGRKWMVD